MKKVKLCYQCTICGKYYFFSEEPAPNFTCGCSGELKFKYSGESHYVNKIPKPSLPENYVKNRGAMKCPFCGGIKVRLLKDVIKSVSPELSSVLAARRGKTYRCKSCKAEW